MLSWNQNSTHAFLAALPTNVSKFSPNTATARLVPLAASSQQFLSCNFAFFTCRCFTSQFVLISLTIQWAKKHYEYICYEYTQCIRQCGILLYHLDFPGRGALKDCCRAGVHPPPPSKPKFRENKEVL